MSSSHDDTILIWDFLDLNAPDIMDVEDPMPEPLSPDTSSVRHVTNDQDSDTVDELDDKDVPYPIQESLAQPSSLPPSPPLHEELEGRLSNNDLSTYSPS